MLIQITNDKLKAWIKNYAAYLQHPNETRSCLLQLEELEQLLNRIKQHNAAGPEKIQGVRLHFIRTEELPCPRPKEQVKKITVNGKQVPQMSVAVVPVTGFKVDEKQSWIARDFFANGATFGLVPGDAAGTGHNPPGPGNEDANG